MILRADGNEATLHSATDWRQRGMVGDPRRPASSTSDDAPDGPEPWATMTLRSPRSRDWPTIPTTVAWRPSTSRHDRDGGLYGVRATSRLEAYGGRVLTLGVDLAAADVRTAIAAVEWSDGQAT